MYKRIVIDFIDYQDQRYDTLGDYYETDGEIHFLISRLPDPSHSYLILFHELWEKFRNMQLGVPDAVVDAFDLAHPDEDPGSLPDAPYHRQHMEALALEKKLCKLLGISFRGYDKAISEYCDANPFPQNDESKSD